MTAPKMFRWLSLSPQESEQLGYKQIYGNVAAVFCQEATGVLIAVYLCFKLHVIYCINDPVFQNFLLHFLTLFSPLCALCFFHVSVNKRRFFSTRCENRFNCFINLTFHVVLRSCINLLPTLLSADKSLRC